MFRPKAFKYAVPFDGNAAGALNVAKTALLALGFEVLMDSKTELHAEGPGMHSNQQPELLGATSIRLNVTSSNIAAEAVLGGVAKMKAFVVLFPPGLVISLLLINNLFGAAVSLLNVLWVLPWLAIGSLIGAALERKTIRAIERLVRGMAQAG